jgi:hypothetical protein
MPTIAEPASRSRSRTWRASALVCRPESALATMIQSQMDVILRTSIAWMSCALMSSRAAMTSFFLPAVVSFFMRALPRARAWHRAGASG